MCKFEFLFALFARPSSGISCQRHLDLNGMGSRSALARRLDRTEVPQVSLALTAPDEAHIRLEGCVSPWLWSKSKTWVLIRTEKMFAMGDRLLKPQRRSDSARLTLHQDAQEMTRQWQQAVEARLVLADVGIGCTRHKAQGTRHKAQGTRHEARGTRHKAQGTRHQAPGTRHKDNM